MTVIESFAAYAARQRASGLPPEATHAAKRALVAFDFVTGSLTADQAAAIIATITDLRYNGSATGTLTSAARLAGWGTPTANTPGIATTGINPDGSERSRLDMLPRVAATALASGPDTASSPAPTERRGALNPGHSRWLMGYAAQWCVAAILAYRKQRAARKAAPRAGKGKSSSTRAPRGKGA